MDLPAKSRPHNHRGRKGRKKKRRFEAARRRTSSYLDRLAHRLQQRLLCQCDAKSPTPSLSLVPLEFDPFSSSGENTIPLTAVPAEVIAHVTNFLEVDSGAATAFSLMMTCSSVRTCVFLDPEFGTYCCLNQEFEISRCAGNGIEPPHEERSEDEEEEEEELAGDEYDHLVIFPFVHAIVLDRACDDQMLRFVGRCLPNVCRIRFIETRDRDPEKPDMMRGCSYEGGTYMYRPIAFCGFGSAEVLSVDSKRRMPETIERVSAILKESGTAERIRDLSFREIQNDYEGDRSGTERQTKLKVDVLATQFPGLRRFSIGNLVDETPVTCWESNDELAIWDHSSLEMCQREAICDLYDLTGESESFCPRNLTRLEVTRAMLDLKQLENLLLMSPLLRDAEFDLIELMRETATVPMESVDDEAQPLPFQIVHPCLRRLVIAFKDVEPPPGFTAFSQQSAMCSFARCCPCLRRVEFAREDFTSKQLVNVLSKLSGLRNLVVERWLIPISSSPREAIDFIAHNLPWLEDLSVFCALLQEDEPQMQVPSGAVGTEIADSPPHLSSVSCLESSSDSQPMLYFSDFVSLLEKYPSLQRVEAIVGRVESRIRSFPTCRLREIIFDGRGDFLFEWRELVSLVNACVLLERLELRQIQVVNYNKRFVPETRERLRILKLIGGIEGVSMAWLWNSFPYLENLVLDLTKQCGPSSTWGSQWPRGLRPLLGLRSLFVGSGSDHPEPVNIGIVSVLKRLPNLRRLRLNRIVFDNRAAAQLVDSKDALSRIPLHRFLMRGQDAGKEGFDAVFQVFGRYLQYFGCDGWTRLDFEALRDGDLPRAPCLSRLFMGGSFMGEPNEPTTKLTGSEFARLDLKQAKARQIVLTSFVKRCLLSFPRLRTLQIGFSVSARKAYWGSNPLSQVIGNAFQADDPLFARWKVWSVASRWDY